MITPIPSQPIPIITLFSGIKHKIPTPSSRAVSPTAIRKHITILCPRITLLPCLKNPIPAEERREPTVRPALEGK